MAWPSHTPSGGRKKEQSGNHLLHFRYAERKPEAPFQRRTVPVIPFKKERFLQANYRFIVSNGDYRENLRDPDLLVDWDNVEEVHFSTASEYNCPICLDICVAPKISKCGHVFCWSCIIRHFSYNANKRHGKCPICFSPIALNDLKSAVIEHLIDFTEGMTIQFTLTKRSKNSSVSLPIQRWSARAEFYPLASDVESIFTRLSVTDDITPILRREQQELQEAAKEAISCQDDSLEYIISAQEALQEKALQTSQKESMILPNSRSNSLELESNPLILESPKPTITPSPHHPQKKVSPSPDEDNFYYAYQSSDGQPLFLHPLNMKMLLRQYGSFEHLPYSIEGEILDRENFVQTESLRKRYKALSHIPLSGHFQFIEIRLKGISSDVLKSFQEEVEKRAQRREKQKLQDKLEKEQEALAKIPKAIDYNSKDFPAPSKIETDSELEMAIKLSLEDVPPLQNEIPQDHSTLTVSEETQSSLETSSPKTTPSFLDVLKSPEKPPANVPVKKTKKGKKYLILSNANSRRTLN